MTKKNFKLSKLACTAAIVSALLPLSACQRKETNDYNLQYNNKNNGAYILNPFDWTRYPEYANISGENDNTKYEVEMTIDEFLKLLNNDDHYVSIGGILLDKENLTKASQNALKDYRADELLYTTAKVVVTLLEGSVVFASVNFVADKVSEKKLRK